MERSGMRDSLSPDFAAHALHPGYEQRDHAMSIPHPGLPSAAALLAVALSVGPALAAADTGRERFPPDSAPYPSGQQRQPEQQGQKATNKKKKEHKSEQELRRQY